MSIFTGSAVALVTPFTSDGVNFESLGKLIDFQIEQGTDALVACGTTGEPPTMSAQEHHDVIEFTVKRAAGRLPVIAGVGSNSTSKVIESALTAEKVGADALLIVNPYYNKTNSRGLFAHYEAISDAVSLPIIIYNVPSRTNSNITPAQLKELSKIKNIKAIKEASGDLSQVLEMKRLCGDKIDIYSGNDDVIVPVMAAGGKGVISVLANIAPKDTHLIVKHFLDGDLNKSLELQLKMLPLIKALFCEVNPIPVKTAMNLMGMNMGKLRLPLYEMSVNNLNSLKQQLEEYGLL